MIDIKDKLVSLEVLKVYHDYNESAYSKLICLTYDDGVVKDSSGNAMSFADISNLSADVTNRVCIVNGSTVMFCMGASASTVDFADLHFRDGRYYIGWISINSNSQASYREDSVALSNDAFDGSWNDLKDKPIASVAQTKAFLDLT